MSAGHEFEKLGTGFLFTEGIVIAVMSWLAFGSDSWHAFFHWMPAFSQAAFTDGLATWFKLQSMFGLVRFFGGSEPLAWLLQSMMSGTVVVALVLVSTGSGFTGRLRR